MSELQAPASRFYYLDNIRSIIIVLVVVFHSILSYTLICPWWYVIDPSPIPSSIFLILFLDIIMMPVLFFISGLFAWLTWSLIHVLFLIGFRNRFRVMVEWIWYYITNRHGTRLIVGK